MNKIRKYFIQDKNDWLKIKKKGFKRYLLYTGFFKLGLIGGILCLTFYYLNSLHFKMSHFILNEYFYGYLIWLPFCIILGIIMSMFIWVVHNQKFNE
jgi:hypothetical protein